MFSFQIFLLLRQEKYEISHKIFKQATGVEPVLANVKTSEYLRLSIVINKDLAETILIDLKENQLAYPWSYC